jgi:hypothetical protein
VPGGLRPRAVRGKLDHPVHEASPVRPRQAIGVKEKPDLPTPAVRRRKTDPARDVVAMKLGVQPRDFR